MTYRIISNKRYGSATLLFTASNGNITIAGANGVSVIAKDDENLAGAAIAQIWFGSPSGNSAYWTIRRGANTVFVADSTAYLDFRGNGVGLTLDPDQPLSCNLFGSTAGSLIVELKKIPAANGFPTL